MKKAVWAAAIAATFIPATSIAQVKDAPCVDNARCEFHFPFSDRELIQPSQLAELPRDILWEARNEIMARHGYAFETPNARDLFGRKAYYWPRTKNVRLNEIEKANVSLIQQFERIATDSYNFSKTPPLMIHARVADLRGTDGFLAVRMGPGTQFTEQYRLDPGQAVVIRHADRGWAEVSFEGGGGWVSSRYLIEGIVPPPPPPQVAIIVQQNPVLNQSPSVENTSDGVRPQPSNLEPTARRASEAPRKVPFYIPGASDTGQMWAEPKVSEEGLLVFNLHFLDPKSTVEKVAYTLTLSPENLQRTITALNKAQEWAEVAKKEKVRDFSKRIDCFPDDLCGQRQPGIAFTDILFRTSEDGEPSLVLQRQLGEFARNYGFTVSNSIQLASVLTNVAQKAEAEFKAGTRTTEELNQLFK